MIRRTARRENFTVLGNAMFADNGLSFEAMGLLAYLLSKPDNWEVQTRSLVKATEGTAQKRGEGKILSLLKELIDAGYITRKKQASGEMNYFVYDEPQAIENKPNPSNPNVANPNVANPNVDLAGVLINTEGQQELNKKKNGGGINARARETPPADLSDSDFSQRVVADNSAANTDTPPVECQTAELVGSTNGNQRAAKAKFEPLSELLALGVDAQVAEDWLAVRRAKRAPLTRSALDGVVREAGKAGLSVGEAVRIAAERGWQGFKADWDWRGGSYGKPRDPALPAGMKNWHDIGAVDHSRHENPDVDDIPWLREEVA